MWTDFKNLCVAFKIFVSKLVATLGVILTKVFAFMGPVSDSVKGVISPEEFYRVLMVAASACGSTYGFFEYILSHANEFITDPTVVTGLKALTDHAHHRRLPMLIFTTVFLFDYIRRKYHHGDPQ